MKSASSMDGPSKRSVVFKVRDGKRPVTELNELEIVEGEIYANIWQTDRIARNLSADRQGHGVDRSDRPSRCALPAESRCGVERHRLRCGKKAALRYPASSGRRCFENPADAEEKSPVR